jgi:hypothetical protein
MNNAFVSSREAELVARAVDALRDATGIHGDILDHPGAGADATVLLTINGRKLRYDCEVKQTVDRYAVPLALLNKLGNAQHTLLVSSPLSPDMADRCRDIGLQFIDTAGNAYINDGAGIYVHVTGRRGNAGLQLPANNTMTPAALKMMFAALAEPALLNAPYRDISIHAKISVGAIAKAFETLASRELIGTGASGKRLIRNPELFLNEWASGYAGRLKPKLRKYRFTADNVDRFLNWVPELGMSAYGGERAAMYLTGHLKPEAYTIYADMDDLTVLRDIVKHCHLRADPRGRIDIVEMFWNPEHFVEWFPTVPPHLVYADLMATHDSRNITVARQIAPAIIRHVHDTTR